METLKPYRLFPFLIFLSFAFLAVIPPSSSSTQDNHTSSDVADKHLIDDIISEIDKHKNKTHDHHHTSTTTTTTTPPTTTTTAAPPCTCGSGARPNISLTRFLDFDDVDREELEDHVGPSERADLENKISEREDNTTRIVHGVTSNANAWPWMASIQYTKATNSMSPNPTNNHFCGGTLINSQYILTAAHCFRIFTNPSPSDFSVILGSNAITSKVSDRTVVKVSQIITHPNFDSTSLANDITLLKLASPVSFSNTIRPICLSQMGSPFANRKVVAAGWGSTNVNGSNPVAYLREAGMKTISNSRCSTLVTASTANITPSMICALGSLPTTNVGTCRGDSGGPLMLYKAKTQTFTQIGIVSYGTRAICGGTGIPDVFTRVNSFTNFIKYVTNGTSFCSNSF